jgi:hypothetical protein
LNLTPHHPKPRLKAGSKTNANILFLKPCLEAGLGAGLICSLKMNYELPLSLDSGSISNKLLLTLVKILCSNGDKSPKKVVFLHFHYLKVVAIQY